LAVIRAAGPADAAAVEAFLLRHVEGAMFPLSNLRLHGLAEGDFASDHPHAMRVWMVDEGVVCVSRAGMVMPMLPKGGDLAALGMALAGMDITGAVGPAPHVRDVLGMLGLVGRPTLRDEDEPGFTLNLAKLRVPDHVGAVIATPGQQDRAFMVASRVAYHTEVLGTDPAKAMAHAEADIEDYLMRGSHRLLRVNGQAVAMTGFNAVLPEIVQIGGVYTPPHLRNRGYARLAVALHLAEARDRGVKRAVLFAANAAAVKAYEAIGFQPAAPVGLVLFDVAQRVAA
jgi:RimJ/RimL family protein N-acetyltransferase